MTANQKISGRIIALMAEHARATGQTMNESLPWAFDKVLGPGSFEAFAADLYDELKAKA